MSDDACRDIERFLYREARLLDERRFREWIALFTDDATYWMPLRSSRFTKDTKAIMMDRDAHQERDITNEREMAFMDETKTTLRMRIERLETGMAWAEEPPSRTRHIVTNIEVEPTDMESERAVYSNFLLFRSRLETEEDIVVGQRQDVLRSGGGTWKIAARKIILAHNVLSAKNLSTFF